MTKVSAVPSHEGCQTTFIDPRLNVAVANALEVDHGRRDVTVAPPLLQCPNVDPVLKIPGCIGVPGTV